MKKNIITGLKQLLIAVLFLYIASGCVVFERLEDLRREADTVLINYPKSNYRNIYIDVSHTNETIPNQYEVLKNQLRENDFDFIQEPTVNSNIPNDTKLLAALREDIGVILLSEPNLELSTQELRGLELFVRFGGRVIVTAPPSARVSSTYSNILSTFGMEVSRSTIELNEPMYFPEIDNGDRPNNPKRGHIMTIEEDILSTNFHEFDQVVMLFPVALAAQNDHAVFNTQEVLTKGTESNKRVTGLKAMDKLSLQEEKGFVYAFGDSFFAKTPIGGGTRLPDRSAYQGGMITSGNYKFLINLITNGDSEINIDNEAPELNLSFSSVDIDDPNSVIFPTGRITDIGGIARISYKINGFDSLINLDALRNAHDRKNVEREFSAGRYIFIPKAFLRPGNNEIEISVTDQFLNTATQVFTLELNITATGKEMHFASVHPEGEVVDPLMGVDLFGSTFGYNNRATFGGPLTEVFWNGDEATGCEPLIGSLFANTLLRSAPSGAARVKSMNMPNTQNAIQQNSGFASLISYGFSTLELDTRNLLILSHTEKRTYQDLEDGFLEFSYNGTPILRGALTDLEILLNHNASRSCNDDTMYFESNVIPSTSFRVLEGLPTREREIAQGILADIQDSRGIRFRGAVFNRIVHGPDSEARAIDPNVIRFPLGVGHPSSANAALGLVGFNIMEVVR